MVRKVLYFKVGSTGIGFDAEAGLPDEVLHICYRMDEVDGDKIVKKGKNIEEKFCPEFRSSWPEASMHNGIWPEQVEDCPLFRNSRGKFYNMMRDADIVVMDNCRFSRSILMQSGFMFPDGKKFVDVVTEYDKLHPEIIPPDQKRSSMDDITNSLSYPKLPESAEEKLDAIVDVYKRLDKTKVNLMDVEDFTKDAIKDSFNFLDIAMKARRKAEEISDILVKEDRLFDANTETFTIRNQYFSSSRDMKEVLRKEEIRRVVGMDKLATVDKVRDVLLSSKVKILNIKNHKSLGRDDRIVEYQVDGRVYHQKYSSEQLDGMTQAYLGRKNCKWYKYEDAELNTEKGLFDKLSNEEQYLVLTGMLKGNGRLSFVPDIEKCSETTQKIFKIAYASDGVDLEISKVDLECALGKSWKEIHDDMFDDFDNMDKLQKKGCINVPLENMVAYRRGKDGSENIIISSELMTAFSMSDKFCETAKDIHILSNPTNEFDKFAYDRILFPQNKELDDVFNVKVYCSGSRSNCGLITTNAERVLIDAGPGYKSLNALLKEDGTTLKGVDIMLLTHEHSDHIKMSASILKDGPAIFASIGTWQGLAKKDLKGLNSDHCFMMPDRLVTKSGLEIRKLDVSHDTNCPTMYQLLKDGKSLVWVTDTGKVTEQVKRAVESADFLVIEANHEERLLQVDPNHPPILQCRIHSNQGHLSNQQTEDLLASLKHPPRKIWLAHISETSNTEEHVRAMIHRAMTRNPSLEFCEFKILKQDENMKMTPRVHKEVPVIPVEYHVSKNKTNSL